MAWLLALLVAADAGYSPGAEMDRLDAEAHAALQAGRPAEADALWDKAYGEGQILFGVAQSAVRRPTERRLGLSNGYVMDVLRRRGPGHPLGREVRGRIIAEAGGGRGPRAGGARSRARSATRATPCAGTSSCGSTACKCGRASARFLG